MKRLFPAFLLSLAFLLSCDSNQPDSANNEGMARFASDSEFKGAHDKPEKIDFQGAGTPITFSTPDGKEGRAYAILNDTNSDKYLFVFHEWWGLNDHIRKEADRLAEEFDNVNVLAIDLYDGRSTDDRDKATEIMKSVTEERAKAIIKGAMNYAGDDAGIATIGWCYGGGWSLKASIMAEDQGLGGVMYYGYPVQKAEALAPLEADILGLFASQDKWITPEVVNDFEALAKATGKSVKTYQFDAPHAFANPSNPHYDKEAAEKANKLAMDFLRSHL